MYVQFRSKERNNAHPLNKNGQFIEPFHNWAEFESCWVEEMKKETLSSTKLIGLLHGIFDFYAAPSIRIPFLLELADGYGDLSGNTFPGDFSYRERGKKEPRREIAQKAWNMLCDNFFKNAPSELKMNNYEFWGEIVKQEVIFKKLLWFFAPEVKNIPYLNPKETRNVAAIEFIKKFAAFVWENSCSNQMFFSARPEIVGVLSEIRSLDLLLGFARNFGIDEMSIGELKEIALDIPCLYKERESLTIENIFLEGRFHQHSEASKILILLEIIRIEQEKKDAREREKAANRNSVERQRAIEEAELAVERAQKHLETIKSSAS